MEPISKAVSLTIPPNSAPSGNQTPSKSTQKQVANPIIIGSSVSVGEIDTHSLETKINALINYMENWVNVGNLNMSDIKSYINSHF